MKYDKNSAPLYEQLVSHRMRAPASFHVPGHKSGQGLDPWASDLFRQVMEIDYTEITGLDDLYQPEGVIAEAQALAADCFGADETFFLVNGSTAGNLAMILAVCERNDLILVQRNVHKSVIHGLMLAGAQAVFLPPRWDAVSGIATGVDPADVMECLNKYPQAKALFISNPNYYGMGVDLRPIIDLMHSRGKPVLVDEAHGAHYGFHPDLPPSALSCGADAVVQSTHKMLTAMTMGAMLHVQGSLLNRELLKQRISMIQTSSPSYPIMATLDLCRRWLHVHGQSAFDQGLKAVDRFSQKLAELRIFKQSGMSPSPVGGVSSSYESKDPFKAAIYDSTGKLSGFELQRYLERFGCMVEMSDLHHVLLAFSLATTEQDCERLLEAFAHIRQLLLSDETSERTSANRLIAQSAPLRQISDPVHMGMHMHGISSIDSSLQGQGATALIPIDQSANQIAAEMVIPYPPGIPVLFPGERISDEMAQYLKNLHEAGARFHNARGAGEQNIRIFIV